MAVVLGLLVSGCGHHDHPGTPVGTGTIVIEQTPDEVAGHWVLGGPSGTREGAGDVTLTEMPAGEYACTWIEVQGWVTPTCVPQTLAAGATVTFTGTYVQIPGRPAEFVLVTAGAFEMGSPEDEPGRLADPHNSGYESLHHVTLTHGLYIQSTEVTNQQYKDLAQWAFDRGYVTATSTSLSDNLDGSTQELLDLGSGACEIAFSDSLFTCLDPDNPVVEVTWYGAAAYCDWLSLQQGLTRAYNHADWQCNGNNPYSAIGYRLSAEAEWEYACRAGSTTAFANGPITQLGCAPVDPNLDRIGWYCANQPSLFHTHRRVAQKNPNAWGLYDMHGNLYEWCNDWNGFYGGAETNPVGPASGGNRVIRGGCFDTGAEGCRSAHRRGLNPDASATTVGFRPVRSAD